MLIYTLIPSCKSPLPAEKNNKIPAGRNPRAVGVDHGNPSICVLCSHSTRTNTPSRILPQPTPFLARLRISTGRSREQGVTCKLMYFALQVSDTAARLDVHGNRSPAGLHKNLHGASPSAPAQTGSRSPPAHYKNTKRAALRSVPACRLL